MLDFCTGHGIPGDLALPSSAHRALDGRKTLPARGWREVGWQHMRYGNVLAIPPGRLVYANGGNAFERELR